MNDELQKQLSEYLARTAGAVEKLVDYSGEQAPELAREIVTWGIMGSLYYGIIFSVIVLIGFIYFIRFVKKYREEGSYSGYGLAAGVTAANTILFFIAAIITLGQAFYAYFAPRLYILEFIKDFLS